MKESIVRLRALEKQRFAYRYALNVVDFDAETVAPEGSADGRAEACEVLSRADFDLLVNDNTAALLRQAAQDAETEQERAEVRELQRAYDQISKIPADEYAAFTKLTQQSIPAWVKAKRTNDFSVFAPYLEKIVAARHAQAHYFAPDRDPYEVLLDQYEHGLTIAQCDEFFATLRELFPTQLADVTEDEIWRAVNRAEPGLIRTEADELTYALHIMVRYEIEKALIQGTLAVADLPAAWNAKYKEYLGVDVPDNAHGCLQDIHWSMGDIGYFPSYALGSAYGAQAIADLRKTMDLDTQWAAGDMEPLKAALKERVWQWGSMKEPQWLVQSLCGGKFDPHYFTRYLKEKYTALYQL